MKNKLDKIAKDTNIYLRKFIKKQIKYGLKNNHTFKGSLINYKKNGSAYNCQIDISPLYNTNKKLKYFLAFEKEIPIFHP